MGDTGSRLSALGSPQTVGALVDEIAARLNVANRGRQAESRGPRAESRELLAALLDVAKHWPLVQANELVEHDVRRRARAAADKRASGAPLAYAVGRANFRHLTLDVDERVLIPRPETERLVDLVLERTAGGIAVDVGTGSGAIAIALATEGKFDRVIATDISLDAIEVARSNAARLGVGNIDFLHGCLLRPAADGVGHQVAAVVSNPPYISFSEIQVLPRSVRDWEPAIALFSGRDGLAVTAQLVRQAAARLESGGLLALEVDARRASLVAELVSSDARYEHIDVKLDFAGRERFVLATRRGGSTA